MKQILLAILCSGIFRVMLAQEINVAMIEKEFPITLQVEKSSVDNPGIDQQKLLQASVMGMAPPVFGFFVGTLNGERHWHFGCMAENTRYERNPCIDMPIGTH